jgi:hypothetical protein
MPSIRLHAIGERKPRERLGEDSHWGAGIEYIVAGNPGLMEMSRRQVEKPVFDPEVFLAKANFGKDGRPEPIIAKVSQETLAEMVGTTRARVSHFMNKFRRLGFIDYNGKLEVHSSLLGVVLHETPRINRDHR